ncbi:hypothetical protein MTO96_023571 [Rhipicephalus appendiculatus]
MGRGLPLPQLCSASETRSCRLLKLLPTLNELLYYLGAEVTEVTPGRIAVRCYRSIQLDLTIGSGFRMVEAVMLLYCIISKHRCIDILEVTLQPRQQDHISPLMCNVLKRMSWLRSFALKGSDLNDEATTTAFEAIARLLRSQLVGLSLECLHLATPSKKACASLDAFATALSASRELKRLRIVDVFFNKEVSVEMFDFVGKMVHALTNNSSCWVAFPVTARSQRMVFEALVTNKTVTTLVIDSFKMGFIDSTTLFEFIASNNTIQDLSLVYTEWDLRQNENKTVTVRWHAQHLADGLRKACSLRRLALFKEFTDAEFRCIVEAAHHSKSLEELHFIHIYGEDVDQISAVQQEMVNNWKVTIGRLWIFAYFSSATELSCFHDILSQRGEAAAFKPIVCTIGSQMWSHPMRRSYILSSHIRQQLSRTALGSR